VVARDRLACVVAEAIDADIAGMGDHRAVGTRVHDRDRRSDVLVAGPTAGGDDRVVGAVHHLPPVDGRAARRDVAGELVEQCSHRGRGCDRAAGSPTHAVGDHEHRALALAPRVLVV
jgi:hypothetical protein